MRAAAERQLGAEDGVGSVVRNLGLGREAERGPLDGRNGSRVRAHVGEPERVAIRQHVVRDGHGARLREVGQNGEGDPRDHLAAQLPATRSVAPIVGDGRGAVGRHGRKRDAGPLESGHERLGTTRTADRVGDGDQPLLDELRQRLLHRLHPAAGAGLHVRVDLLDLALADEVPDRVVEEEDLESADAAGAVCLLEQRLGDDALEGVGELHAHLVLLRGREDVDDAVDRARRALRVQRREDEVAGLGRGQRGRDRLEVAHLAEEDHVGVLAERGAQSVGERGRVRADLALVDDAALVVVQELDRVLDRHDVVGAHAVDLVDHRRERRRLARAGRAR